MLPIPMFGPSLLFVHSQCVALFLYLLDAGEVIMAKPFGSDGPVVSFYIGVLPGFSGLDIDQPDPGFSAQFCSLALTYSGP